MLRSSPEMPEYMILAIEHHKHLLEEAQRHRDQKAARELQAEPPLRWHRLRFRVGELLINAGRRIKPDATDAVWG